MIVYIVTMCRWGDEDNHSYPIGVFSTLRKALEAGIEHSNYRAGKYEPKVLACKIDEGTVNEGPMHDNICRSKEHAMKLLEDMVAK